MHSIFPLHLYEGNHAVLEREKPVLVQEDRKRRFFMLDEIRIAEGEGKVVGEFLKMPNTSGRVRKAGRCRHAISKKSWNVMEYHGISWNVMEYHGISWNIMEYHGISWDHVSFFTHCGT